MFLADFFAFFDLKKKKASDKLFFFFFFFQPVEISHPS
jgi:hypothetical protein